MQHAPRLYVPEGVLLEGAKIDAELYQVFPTRIGGRIHRLKNVGHAVLGIVVIVSDRRKIGHGDETQSEITRIR